MTLLQSLLGTVGWLLCVVYSTIPCFWFLVHPYTKFWRARRRSPYLLLIPGWMVIWLAVGLITAPWRNLTLYASPLSWIPAVFLFAFGFWIYAQTARQFTPAQLGGVPEIAARQGAQRLVITGIHGRVRHPVYLAHLCEMLGWTLGTGLAVLFALTAFAILTGAMMIRLEDAELEQRFGDEYRNYRLRVPAVVPRLFR